MAQTMKWLLFLDLDGTLWDHMDISSLVLPFHGNAGHSISDARGEAISLKPGALDFLRWVRSNGGILTSCSWNEPEFAMAALDAFGLTKEFDHHRISVSPRKDLAMLDLMDELSMKKISFSRDLIFYLDDREIHMESVRKSLPKLEFLHMGNKVRNFEEAEKVISGKLKSLQWTPT